MVRALASRCRRNSRARCARDFTVPTVTPSTCAASTFDRPSTSRSTTAARYSAGSWSIAAVSASRSSVVREGSPSWADQSAIGSPWPVSWNTGSTSSSEISARREARRRSF
jgi:hypothetical protein